MKKFILATALFWAALANAFTFIVVPGQVCVSGGTRVAIPGFTNIASGIFSGSSGDGQGNDGTYLYGTSSMYSYEYNQPFSVGVWVFQGIRNGSGAVSYASKINTNAAQTTFRGWSLGTNGAGGIANAVAVYFELCNTINNRVGVSTDPTNDLHLGQWNFVVGTWDGNVAGGAAGAKIYVNGVLQSTNVISDTLGTSTIVNPAAFSLGGFTTDTGTEGYERLKGNLNQITLWSKALSGAEISALYSFSSGAPSDPRTAGPVASLLDYYPLVSSKDNSVTIQDVVGSNNLTNSGVALNGALQPNPLYQNASSGSFDGAASYLDLGANYGTNVNTTPVTYSIWLKPTSLPSNGTYYAILQKQIAGGTGFHLYMDNFAANDGSSLNFAMVGTGGGNIVVNGPTGVFTAGSWTHLTVSYDGSGTAAGVAMWKGTTALTTTVVSDTLVASADTGVNFILGQWNSSRYYNGLMDEFSIYNRVLNSSDITTIDGGGHPPDLTNFSPLVGWFRFENAGQYNGYATDTSSQVNDRVGFIGGTNYGVTFSSSVP